MLRTRARTASRPVPAPKSRTSPVWQAKPHARAPRWNSSTRRVLPMPASPRRWRTCPRPPERQVASAVSRTPSSARRPTKGAARSAPAAGPSRRQQRTAPSNPLAGSAPRWAHSIRPKSVARTASETRISPGPAASARRAARFTDSPVTVYSRCASLPVPLATTWPPARPMCTCSARPIPAAMDGTASRMARAARAARSASLPWDTGAPNTAITQSPMCLSTRPPCSCTIRSARPKKRPSSACVSSAPSSRPSAVKPARSAKRTATCRRSPSRSGSGCRRPFPRGRGDARVGPAPQGRDGAEDLLPVPERGDAEGQEVGVRQVGQHVGVDRVLEEGRRVLAEPEPAQPCRDVHAPVPPVLPAASL